METNKFLAEKLKIKQFIPILFFILFPLLLFLLQQIDLKVLIQFILLSLICTGIILFWHFNTKITITHESISYRSAFKYYKLKWKDVKMIGAFTATGLTVIEFGIPAKKQFLNSGYIYITTIEDLKFSFVKKNSNTFIRFNYNEEAYNLINKLQPN